MARLWPRGAGVVTPRAFRASRWCRGTGAGTGQLYVLFFIALSAGRPPVWSDLPPSSADAIDFVNHCGLELRRPAVGLFDARLHTRSGRRPRAVNVANVVCIDA